MFAHVGKFSQYWLENRLDAHGVVGEKWGFQLYDPFCDLPNYPQKLLRLLKDKGPVLIDATEQRTQRPEDDAYQKQLYSGKKKPIPSRPYYWRPRIATFIL